MAKRRTRKQKEDAARRRFSPTTSEVTTSQTSGEFNLHSLTDNSPQTEIKEVAPETIGDIKYIKSDLTRALVVITLALALEIGVYWVMRLGIIPWRF